MIVERFEPIALRVEEVGPFDQEYVLDFMKAFDNETEDPRPARFFLLASQNARGKTTLLEAFALGMSILGGEKRSLPLTEDLLRRNGRIQLDVRVTSIFKNRRSDLILSLCAGGKMYEYLPTELSRLNASDGQEYIVASPALKDIRPEGGIAQQFIDSIAHLDSGAFRGLFNEELTFPTAVYFSCDRGVVRPPSNEIVIAKPGNLDYQPCHVIGREEGDWRNSIDNLFCWLAWLSHDDKSSSTSFFEEACEHVNTLVFSEPEKRLRLLSRDPPHPFVMAQGQYHRLDRLSSGERARLQFVVRTASLMTAHTILLIDELELHLHPVWQHRLIDTLIELIRRHPGLHVYYTTHSKELVERGIQLSFAGDEAFVASHRIIS